MRTRIPHVPVAGLPLDANRCARWLGRFEENSVSMERLRELLGPASTPEGA